LMRNAALASDLFSGLGVFGIVLLVALAAFAVFMLRRIADHRRRRMTLCERAHLAKVISARKLPSTNDHLKELVASGQAQTGDALLILAHEQKAGRGQFERRWSSPPGGLYASLLYWPARPVAEQSELSLLSAQVLCEVLTSQGMPGLFVKAPNDLYAGKGKLAGTLLEASGQAGWLIIGIGVNVRRPRRHAFEGAAYLSDELSGQTPEDVADALFPVLLERIRAWDKNET